MIIVFLQKNKAKNRGLILLQLDELTDDWKDWTKHRSETFVADKDKHTSVMGAETYLYC